MLSCDIVQVDDSFIANSVGNRVVQVDNININCKATALGSDVVQVDNLFNPTHAQGRDVVQVVNCYSEALNEGNSVVQVGDLSKPSKALGEGLHKVICSRGLKRRRSK